MSLFDKILESRGVKPDDRSDFLSPNYDKLHDPNLMPDMNVAIDRLVKARERQDNIVIYGDYDIDGLTASTLLMDAFDSFGYDNVEVFIPNRFIEGYGLASSAIEKIVASGADLIITVDCGSLSEKEIKLANKLGVDVIVTDHHNVADKQPPAVAVINPKRVDSKYPFKDLASVGVAFKLVEAMRQRLPGLQGGQEKWLLDLVALGTVCDVVSLQDENRALVHWGLKVMSQTRRPGLKALMAVAGVDSTKLNAKDLGFRLGPRLNAAGRLETAKYALDLLMTSDKQSAMVLARQLDELNSKRRDDQNEIFKAAVAKAELHQEDPVLVVSDKDWNHGIIGIVAAKLLEKYKKPTFVLQELSDGVAKGSARSYGDFSAAEAIKYCNDLITKGGGHHYAAGLTLSTIQIDNFRKQVNIFYHSQYNLDHQQKLLLPSEDLIINLNELTDNEVEKLSQLEPYGNGNPEPVLRSDDLKIINLRTMGSDGQHFKIEAIDAGGQVMTFVAFSAPREYFVAVGSVVSIWYTPGFNDWNGSRKIEGRLIHIKVLN